MCSCSCAFARALSLSKSRCNKHVAASSGLMEEHYLSTRGRPMWRFPVVFTGVSTARPPFLFCPTKLRKRPLPVCGVLRRVRRTTCLSSCEPVLLLVVLRSMCNVFLFVFVPQPPSVQPASKDKVVCTRQERKEHLQVIRSQFWQMFATFVLPRNAACCATHVSLRWPDVIEHSTLKQS